MCLFSELNLIVSSLDCNKLFSLLGIKWLFGKNTKPLKNALVDVLYNNLLGEYQIPTEKIEPDGSE